MGGACGEGFWEELVEKVFGRSLWQKLMGSKALMGRACGEGFWEELVGGVFFCGEIYINTFG